jgi:hypothetical protein
MNAENIIEIYDNNENVNSSDTEILIFDIHNRAEYIEGIKNNILKNKAKNNAYNKKSYYKRKEKIKVSLTTSETKPKGRKQNIITDEDIKLYIDTNKLKETKIKQKRGPKQKIYPAYDVQPDMELKIDENK